MVAAATELRQQITAAMATAAHRGISSDQLGDEIALRVASTLTAMVRDGLAWQATALGKNRQKRWFGTMAWRDAYVQAQEAQRQPRKRVGRPLGGIKWAADAVVVRPDHVQVQYGVGVQLGLRTNTHRNGL